MQGVRDRRAIGDQGYSQIQGDRMRILFSQAFDDRSGNVRGKIAAIDNVTRKLMQEGQRPAAVGFLFSLGHSIIVVLASVAVAATATASP
jgi:high-affinity nickel permease